MSNPRPHANSRQIDANTTSDLMMKSKLLSQLLPNPPSFTVVITVAFPHDDLDIVDDEEEDEDAIQRSHTLYIKAANVHTAIDMALAQVADSLQEESDESYSLMCSGAFAGIHEDLSHTYSYKLSGLFDEEEALAGMDIDTYTG